MTTARRWTLMSHETALGTLALDEADFPWLFCHFIPTRAFEEVRPLFVAEQAAFEADEAAGLLGDREEGQWEQAYDAIDALQLRLVDEENGDIIDNLLLHIDGDAVWFRY